MKLLWLLILITFYSSVDGAKSYNPLNINCYIKHLKSVNKLNQKMQEISASNEIEDCDHFVASMRKEMVKETVKTLGTEFEITNKESCVAMNLNNSDFVDMTLKVVVYEVLGEASSKDYQVEKKEANEKVENDIMDAVILCLFQEEYGQLFDEMLTPTENEEEDIEADYCARKAIVNDHLINPSYNLTLNPKNIDTSSINCIEKLKELDFELEKELKNGLLEDEPDISSNSLNCRVRICNENNYTRKIIATSLLSEVNLTEAQKMVERNKFIIFMGRIGFKTGECSDT